MAVFGLLAGMLVTTAPLTAPAALAAPGDPFDPARPTVFVAQSPAGGTTTLYRSETAGDGSFAFTERPDAARLVESLLLLLLLLLLLRFVSSLRSSLNDR